MLVELLFVIASLTSSECSAGAALTGECATVSAEVTDDRVELEANTSSGSNGNQGSGDQPADPPVDPVDAACGVFIDICQITVTTPVTLADIAAFRPGTASHGMQPNGWAVIGLPTNFFSNGGAQIDTGTLLGQSAEVRFTPVGWAWNYGDGTSRTAASPGQRWSADAEFEPTATTHVFEQRGTYTVTLTVRYRAEWRVAGGSWVPISGILSLPAPPQQVLVTGARTVLVDEDCRANPTGPGC